MTSSKHSGNNYQFVLNELLSKLNNYEVLRKKIEIQPEETKHANHVYYETHLRLKLPKDFDRTPIKNLCKEFNFHFSKNLFKKSDDFVWQMITYRDYNSDLVSFNEVIVNISKKLKELNIYCDKIEIEECIFDSNEKIDDTWLK